MFPPKKKHWFSTVWYQWCAVSRKR